MERKPILSDNDNEPFFDRLSTAIDTTLSHINTTLDLSRNFHKLNDRTDFFKTELELLELADDIYAETSTLYDEVRSNPINADPIENRLLSLRAQLISLNENSTLIKKGLPPFIPTSTSVLADSSYLSPVSNNRSQSFKNSFNSTAKKPAGTPNSAANRSNNVVNSVKRSVKKSAVKPASVKKEETKQSIDCNQLDFCPDSYDSPVRTRNTHLPDKFNLAASVKKSAKKLTQPDNDENLHNTNGMSANDGNKPLSNIDLNIEQQKNGDDQESLFKRNFSNPEMNNVMARLAAWSKMTLDDDDDNDIEKDSDPNPERDARRLRTRTFILRENV